MKKAVIKWFNNHDNLEYVKATGKFSFYKNIDRVTAGDIIYVIQRMRHNSVTVTTGVHAFLINEVVNTNNSIGWPHTPLEPQVWGANTTYLGEIDERIIKAELKSLGKQGKRDLQYLFDPYGKAALV